MRCLITFWVCLIFHPLMLLGKEPGIVIVLYGTPCAGKSTVAADLLEKLPQEFKIVKKTQIENERRQALIQRATGKLADCQEEIVKDFAHLPQQYKSEAKNILKGAVRDTIAKINSMTAQGDNIIFDISTDHPEELNSLRGKRVIRILVYAPLSSLYERDMLRKIHAKQSEFYRKRRLKIILSMFNKLYRPVLYRSKDAIDTVAKEELEQFKQLIEGESEFLEKQDKNQKLVGKICLLKQGLELDQKNITAIAPRVKPDLVLNTATNTAEKLINKVIQYLEERPLVQQHTIEGLYQVLSKEMPELEISKIKKMPSSFSYTVIDVNGEWIFRFPKDRVVSQKLVQETKLLGLLQERIDLSIPDYRVVGKTVAMVGYQKIPGKKLNRSGYRSLNMASRDQIAKTLATFLYQMHTALSLREAEEIGYQRYSVGVQKLEERLAGTFDDSRLNTLLDHALEAYKNQNIDRQPPVLLHRDLHGRNIVYDDKRKKINGMIDFTNVQLGEPAIDFTKLFSVDPDLVRRVTAVYSRLSGREDLYRRALTLRVLQVAEQILMAREREEHDFFSKKLHVLKQTAQVWEENGS